MCIQHFIKIYEKVQEIGTGSFLSESEPRQNLDQSQMTYDNLLGYILSLSMCMQNFITIFHSAQEIRQFSRFQNLELGKASTDDKCHFSISWARSYQHQRVPKICSKYSKWFTSYRHFSFFVRGQNFHKQSGDIIFTNCPVTKSNV